MQEFQGLTEEEVREACMERGLSIRRPLAELKVCPINLLSPHSPGSSLLTLFVGSTRRLAQFGDDTLLEASIINLCPWI